eukprot:Nk52_evm57s1073 gene=Nk52_evmTU57s1073
MSDNNIVGIANSLKTDIEIVPASPSYMSEASPSNSTTVNGQYTAGLSKGQVVDSSLTARQSASPGVVPASPEQLNSILGMNSQQPIDFTGAAAPNGNEFINVLNTVVANSPPIGNVALPNGSAFPGQDMKPTQEMLNQYKQQQQQKQVADLQQNAKPGMPTFVPNLIYVSNQPSKFGRFRYKSEQRECVIDSEKGFPTVAVNAQFSSLVPFGTPISVSLVTKTLNSNGEPDPHWHELSGSQSVPLQEGLYAVFDELSILMEKNSGINVKKANVQTKKENQRACRLLFEITFSVNGQPFYGRCVSDPIFNANLRISKLSHSQGSAAGGNEAIVLCSKVRKATTLIRVSDFGVPGYAGEQGNEDEEKLSSWRVDARTGLGSCIVRSERLSFHHQFAIIVEMPSYHDPLIEHPVTVQIQLIDKEDETESAPVQYTYIPSEHVKRELIGQSKKRKLDDGMRDFWNNLGHGGPFNDPGAGPGGFGGGYGGPGMGGGPGAGGAGGYDFSGGHGGGGFNFAGGQGGAGFGRNFAGDNKTDEYSGKGEGEGVEKSNDNQPMDEGEGGEKRKERDDDENNGDKENRRAAYMNHMKRLASSHRDAIKYFAVTGESKYLLALERHLVPLCDDEGSMPLHYALENNRADAAHNLLSIMKPAEVNTPDEMGKTPLHLAVLGNDANVVESVLRAGANIHLTDNEGNTPLHCAALVGASESMRVLLNYAFNKPAGNKNMDFEVPLVGSKTYEYLHKFNFRSLSPLHCAVEGLHVQALEMLVSAGADLDLKDGSSGSTALHMAVKMNSPVFAMSLLGNGIGRHSHTERVADPNSQDFFGNTALHVAVDRNLTNLAMVLIDAGASPTGVINEEGFSCEGLAQSKNLTAMVQILQGGAQMRPSQQHREQIQQILSRRESEISSDAKPSRRKSSSARRGRHSLLDGKKKSQQLVDPATYDMVYDDWVSMDDKLAGMKLAEKGKHQVESHTSSTHSGQTAGTVRVKNRIKIKRRAKKEKTGKPEPSSTEAQITADNQVATV